MKTLLLVAGGLAMAGLAYWIVLAAVLDTMDRGLRGLLP